MVKLFLPANRLRYFEVGDSGSASDTETSDLGGLMDAEEEVHDESEGWEERGDNSVFRVGGT